MNAVAKSMNDVEAATRRLYDVREDSRVECVRTIRRMEEQLTAFLVNEPLRGMPNMMPGDRKLLAMRVRGKHQEPLPSPKGPDLHGPWTLILLPTGRLAKARRVRLPGFVEGWVSEVQEATDNDLIAQDMHAVTKTICEAMHRHIESLEKTSASYSTLRMMAFGMSELLDRVFPPE